MCLALNFYELTLFLLFTFVDFRLCHLQCNNTPVDPRGKNLFQSQFSLSFLLHEIQKFKMSHGAFGGTFSTMAITTIFSLKSQAIVINVYCTEK